MKKIALLLLLVSSIVFSQDELKQVKPETAVHLREIPRHNLALAFGVAQPFGDYSDVARSGLNVGLDYTYYTNKYLGLSAGLRHQYNEFGYLDTDTNPQNVISSNNYMTTSITVGPTFSYTKNRFQLDVMFKGGMAFYNNPENAVINNELQDAPSRVLYQSDDANSKSASAFIEGGLRFNYYFRRSVQLFFSPQLNTTLGKPYGYNFLDESSTSFNPEEVRTINASNFTLNFGIKIALTPEYTSGEDRYDGDE
ncbi:hypothetical protein BBFL7_00324 [Flavobacteria bacterium BBFL7]|nr:hypothetical protein BBFL7_00324 [Flavobacteria bacterium BBFL7]